MILYQSFNWTGCSSTQLNQLRFLNHPLPSPFYPVFCRVQRSRTRGANRASKVSAVCAQLRARQVLERRLLHAARCSAKVRRSPVARSLLNGGFFLHLGGCDCAWFFFASTQSGARRGRGTSRGWQEQPTSDHQHDRWGTLCVCVCVRARALWYRPFVLIVGSVNWRFCCIV